ncbi:hypothetical protein PG985_005285 [Apiospora marii]|uniref:Uncharacterized protein n=1 Tax=Apiospora marii TaxID=335849 RepID=A0ABR1SBJ8_9PEZI
MATGTLLSTLAPAESALPSEQSMSVRKGGFALRNHVLAARTRKIISETAYAYYEKCIVKPAVGALRPSFMGFYDVGA